jgi:rod shape-determining protein MreC
VLKSNKRSIILSAVYFSFLVLFSSLIPALRNPALCLLKLPLEFATFLKGEIGGVIFYHKNLTQNRILKIQIDLLKNKLNEKQEIYLENRRLNNLLFFKQKLPYRVIAARVIGRDPSNWSSTLIIDKGKSYGIKKGFVCVTYLGLIGRVAEVNDSASKIMLINDPNFSVSALVQRSRQEGLVCGSLSSSLMMKYLSYDSDIKVSDKVVTSGLTPSYPKGLVIGTVVAIGEEFSGLSRYCLIKPAVELSSLEEILIIIP